MSIDSVIWDAYNLLLTGPDIERLRKILVRNELFRMTLDIPGDIVECGVLKGASLLLFLKLLHIYAHGSNKRVIGFDLFDSFPVSDQYEAERVQQFVQEAQFDGVLPAELLDKVAAAGMNRERCELVAGDITTTAQRYVDEHPGLRISLLHIDLDIEAGTYAALEAFWPRVVTGGIIVFDEYAVPQWTESRAVDRFFANKSIKLRTIPWARTPSAYLVKENP